jgi:hypothetical protein
VLQDAPSISTATSTGSVAIGGSIYDTAVLTGAFPSAAGTVTYDVYSDATCTPGDLVSSIGTVDVTSGVVPDSPSWSPSVIAGTYYFVASYSGDANDVATTSDCGAEPVLVIL